ITGTVQPPTGFVTPNMLPMATGQVFPYPDILNFTYFLVDALYNLASNLIHMLHQGPISIMPVQAMTQQATRHARRVYVGGLPPRANEQSVAKFFSQVMAAIGGNTAGSGDAVVNVDINHENKFAFVEMRSVEEASNAMALDGILLEGTPVKVRRPSDYSPTLAATLGPSQPSPNLDLAAVGLSPGLAGGLGPDHIFVGGLPYSYTESQIRELLESFGPLQGFDLVKVQKTGNSEGYAFCVYSDPSVTDVACAALNGIKMGNETLTVRRANQTTVQPKPEQEIVLQHAQQQILLQKMMFQPGALPTKVVSLTQVVTADDMKDDEEYQDIMVDMKEEGEKFGGYLYSLTPPPPTSRREDVIWYIWHYFCASGTSGTTFSASGTIIDGEDNILDILNEEISEELDDELVVDEENREIRESGNELKGKRNKKKNRRLKKKKKMGRRIAKFNVNSYVLEVCKQIKEKNLFLVYATIDLIGKCAFEQLIDQVRAIQASGGQQTYAGDRHKTGGGILWSLLKRQNQVAYREVMQKLEHIRVSNAVKKTVFDAVQFLDTLNPTSRLAKRSRSLDVKKLCSGIDLGDVG
ncbi:hypothetical protein KSS87_009929, partial [Heliosperma pusillum]